MQQVLDSILTADSYSWTVVTLMAFVFAAFVSSTLGNMLYSLTLFPAFMAGGLSALATFRSFAVVLVPERQFEIVVESAIGMMVALLAVLLLARIYMMLYGLTIKPARKGTRERAMAAR